MNPANRSITIAMGLVFMVVTHQALALSPAEMLSNYSTKAKSGFSANAARGQAFYRQNFTHNPKMTSCQSCHTANPKNEGEHTITGKKISPLAVAGNDKRFTDIEKTEKWFTRNCKEVVGRECSIEEKADFIKYMMEVK